MPDSPPSPTVGSGTETGPEAAAQTKPRKPASANIHTHASRRVDRGKARRPMVEWCLYAAGLGVMVAFVAGPFIRAAVENDLRQAADQRGTYVSIIILALFGFAVVKNFFDIRFIHRQARLTDRQISTLRESNNIYVFLQNSEPSLFRDHIDNLHEIFRRDCNISQDNLVTLLQARLLAKTRLVEFCSSILVTLGLVGTIIGLIQSAGGLTEVFTAMTSEEGTLMDGVDAAIGGMGVAFYTTLMGAILGGVCLRLLSNLVDANTEHIVSHIAELTEIYILPILRRAGRINEEHQQKLREKGVGLPSGVPIPGTVGTGQTTAAPM
ncbi:MAG: MotA/TolQ/ExbB proton channel family protein, partial [Phycisphaeraceae bacterium]